MGKKVLAITSCISNGRVYSVFNVLFSSVGL